MLLAIDLTRKVLRRCFTYGVTHVTEEDVTGVYPVYQARRNFSVRRNIRIRKSIFIQVLAR